MTLPSSRWRRLPRRTVRLRLPRRTVRLRLTLLYGGLFLVSGAGLLAITYVLVAAKFQGKHVVTGPTGAVPTGGFAPPESARTDQARERAAQLHLLLGQSGIALAIMAVVAVGLGWLVAGRILRPLRAMTATTRHISADNLHQRLAVPGPSDELKDLGDTIDGLLARLEAAFDAQRRFVANASHELRTPLTLERAMLEVALADPDATATSLRATCEDVLATGQQQERMIEALLTLARSQQGLDEREPVDLAAVAAAVLGGRQAEAHHRGLHLTATLDPAAASGDPRLLERLVANLVDNALRHNTRHGRIEVTTGTRAGRATLSVTNTGPPIPAGEVERLLQPFQRLATDRTAEHDGLGLGLSIIAAIAAAHGALLTPRALPGGGLDVHVGFPARTAVPTGTPARR